jgi:parallel beta-helix repeat protein
MKASLKKTVWIVGICIVLGAVAWAGDGQIDIATIPYTISSSGSYIVVRDLATTATDTNGITIQADNVTLDLNGHTLTGPGKIAGTSGSGIYVDGTRFNITIGNGTMRDWRQRGVSAVSASNSQFEALRCYNNGDSGVSVGSDSTISGNTCNSNGLHGILAGYGSTISDNTCYGNGSCGIWASAGSTVSRNTCRANGTAGINAGNGCTLDGNTCFTNAGYGINAGEGCTVSGNTSRSNGDDGILSYNGGLISGNACMNNTGDGIQVQAYCQVVDNNCNGNGYSTGDAAGIHATATNNQIMNNHCTGNDRGLDLDGANNIVSGNTLRGNTTPVDAVANNQLDILISELPYTISLPGMYRLSGDLYLATQDTHGITISADNVTLDLNGHALIGPGKAAGSPGYAIYISGTPQYNIAIRNGTIRDWRGTAVSGAYANNSQIESLRCYNNGGNGIYVGFDAKIIGNNCYNNSGDGINAGDYSTASGNVCNFNGQKGISTSSGCTIVDNTCCYNGGVGIDSTYGCTLTQNSCEYNGSDGISAIDGCTVTGNSCTRNSGNGIMAYYDCTVNENTCYFNTNGAEVRLDCRVMFNTCVYNSSAGILAYATPDPASGNSIESNLVDENYIGIDCDPGSENFIASNRAMGNTLQDYAFAAGNAYGTIVDATAGGVLPSTNYFANYRF